jgi:hypothetical protein
MKRKKQHRQKRVAASSETFLTVDAIWRLAQRLGWPGERGFHIALFVALHGTSPTEAKALRVAMAELATVPRQSL